MKKIPLLLALLVMLSSVSQAKESPMTYLGGLVGVGAPSDWSSSMMIGGTFGRRMTPDFGVGAYAFRVAGDQQNMLSSGGAVPSITVMAYGMEGNYYFAGDMDGLSVGLKLGLANRSFENGAITVATTPLSVGPKLSFDYRLVSQFSIGFEASVLFQSSHTNQAGYSLVNMLAAGKLWF